MDYRDINLKLRKPTQFICVKISVQHRHFHNAKERLEADVKSWVKNIVDGKAECDDEGYFKTPFRVVLCRGTKENCQRAAQEYRFERREYGSTSRLVQIGLWSDSWRVLPADENGNWIPTATMIKKALESIQKD